MMMVETFESFWNLVFFFFLSFLNKRDTRWFYNPLTYNLAVHYCNLLISITTQQASGYQLVHSGNWNKTTDCHFVFVPSSRERILQALLAQDSSS